MIKIEFDSLNKFYRIFYVKHKLNRTELISNFIRNKEIEQELFAFFNFIIKHKQENEKVNILRYYTKIYESKIKYLFLDIILKELSITNLFPFDYILDRFYTLLILDNAKNSLQLKNQIINEFQTENIGKIREEDLAGFIILLDKNILRIINYLKENNLKIT